MIARILNLISKLGACASYRSESQQNGTLMDIGDVKAVAVAHEQSIRDAGKWQTLCVAVG